MIYEPHFSQFNGKGIFTSGNFSIEAEFTVERQFSYVLFVTEKVKLAEAFGDAENWSLSGQLTMAGRFPSSNFAESKLEAPIEVPPSLRRPR
jgi:hypothetical protein